MKIFLCGDIMIGRGIDQILRNPSAPLIHESYLKDARDYVLLAEQITGRIPRQVSDEYIWGDALGIWKNRRPDLKIANLETAITTSEAFLSGKGIHYRMHPDNISVLSPAQINIFSLANNHILDWDEKGLSDTILALDHSHIQHAGAGRTLGEAQSPAIFEDKNGRALVFAMGLESSGVPETWGAKQESAGVFFLENLSDKAIANINSMIDKYKKPTDIVIVSIHWGSNWGYDIPQSQRDFAHSLIDLVGVDIIHGHSSHHPRPIEIYKGHPIFYGCGDFINDYEGISGYETYRDDLVLMYFLECESNPFKLYKIDLICLQINKFKLRHALKKDVKWILHTLNKKCQLFHTQFELLEENVISVKN